jgi:hypothetical protein
MAIKEVKSEFDKAMVTCDKAEHAFRDVVDLSGSSNKNELCRAAIDMFIHMDACIRERRAVVELARLRLPIWARPCVWVMDYSVAQNERQWERFKHENSALFSKLTHT